MKDYTDLIHRNDAIRLLEERRDSVLDAGEWEIKKAIDILKGLPVVPLCDPSDAARIAELTEELQKVRKSDSEHFMACQFWESRFRRLVRDFDEVRGELRAYREILAKTLSSEKEVETSETEV